MKQSNFLFLAMIATCIAPVARGERARSCADVANVKIEGVEITKTAPVPREPPFRRPIPELRAQVRCPRIAASTV